MATDVVLPPGFQLTRWHYTENTSRPCPTATESSSLPLSSMARLPSGTEATGDAFSHKPRLPSLPSFSNFLSGAGRPDLKFAPPSPGPSRGDPSLASNAPSSVHPALSPMYGRVDQKPLIPSETHSHPRSIHLDPSHASAWPYTNSSPLERPAALPGIYPVGPPLDRANGRIVVREDNIPGRGRCYVYDDGTVCEKVINGDAVNPKWGTTKAGKPRKRLGQACNTCREKKIKCDPSVPKCAQCQKFGRECKFDSAPRAGGRQTGSLPPNSGPMSSFIDQKQEGRPDRRGSTASAELAIQDFPYSKATSRSSMPLETLLSPTNEDDVTTEGGLDNRPLAKKPRFSVSPRPASEGWPSESMGTESRTASTSSPTALPSFSWQTDPYQLDRDLTLYYMGKYFTHVDSATYGTLPRKPFTQWVKTCRSKSLADKMLLYAILAMGTVFARRPETEGHRKLFTEIANEAVHESANAFTLQLVQTRLILALLHFSQGQYNRAWDFCGSSCRTAFGLRYNTEEGVCAMGNNKEPDFGLDYATLAECRRRTFWSAYIMDCFNGCCSVSTATVYRSDCRLRLPCAQDAYERGDIPLTSFDLDSFSNSGDSPAAFREESSEVGLLGYLVQIATIFNEVVTRIGRTQVEPAPKYSSSLETFYQDVMARLNTWDKLLRRHLHKSQNSGDKPEPVCGLHVLYHYTAMIVHRYVRHANVDQQQINVHVRGAYDHARFMLEMVQRLSNDKGKEAPLFLFATVSPFSGFAITAALDIVTAAGTLSDLMDHKSQMMSLISSGLEALEGLVDFWYSARRQQDMIKQRFGILLTATKRASDFNGAFYFGQPMQSPFGLEQDIVYGLPRMRYFQAMGWEDKIHHEGDFHRLDNGKSCDTTRLI